MIRIIVDTEKEKERLLEESLFIHKQRHVDVNFCNTLAHIYTYPDIIEVAEKEKISNGFSA